MLKLLNSNSKNPYLIWNNGTRAELLEFLMHQQEVERREHTRHAAGHLPCLSINSVGLCSPFGLRPSLLVFALQHQVFHILWYVTLLHLLHNSLTLFFFSCRASVIAMISLFTMTDVILLFRPLI